MRNLIRILLLFSVIIITSCDQLESLFDSSDAIEDEGNAIGDSNSSGTDGDENSGDSNSGGSV